MSERAILDPANRVQLPAAWLAALGLHGTVLLEKTETGILVRPCPPVSWDEVFAEKLAVRPGSPDADDCQATKDDLLF